MMKFLLLLIFWTEGFVRRAWSTRRLRRLAMEPPRDREGIERVVKEHVLPLLPAKSLLQYRAVCKDWRQWISNPFLAHKQSVFFRKVSGIFSQLPGVFETIKFSSRCAKVYGVPDPSLSFLPEEVDIKDSCNGLICCRGLETYNSYYVCNPVKRDWKLLPEPRYYHSPGSVILLAFEPGMLNFSANYKLVCAIPLTDVIMFDVFSSRTDSWRISEAVCDELAGAEFTGYGLHLDGVLYWEVVNNLLEPGMGTRFVLTFNVKDEQYGIMKLPDAAGPHGALAEIRGELCYIVACKDPWEFHIYGGMDMNLKRYVEIQLGELDRSQECFRALACVDDGDVMLFLLGNDLISYRISTREIEVLSSNPTMVGSESRYFLHVNSLVDICPPR